MRRVFIIHRWSGGPEDDWRLWLKNELQKLGYEVLVPNMPDIDTPVIKKWVGKLSEVVGLPDSKTYFVGHSIGCQTIARYLESLPEGVKVGGAVFVGGFFKHLTGLESDLETQTVRKDWLETPLDLMQVKSHLPKSVAIFSDNDPFVPLDNQDDFRDKLGSRILVEHNKGHFNDEGLGTKELPIVLEAVLELIGTSN